MSFKLLKLIKIDEIKIDELASQGVGFACSAGAAWKVFGDDITNTFLKAILIIISGIVGGAAGMLGKYWMKKYLNRGLNSEKEEKQL